MATLTLSPAELARLLESEPRGRLRLKGLDRDRVVVQVKPGFPLPSLDLVVVVVECREGHLRLRLGPETLLRMAGGLLAEHGLRHTGDGVWEVDSAALLGRWLPGARLDEVALAPEGMRLQLSL